ncbi:MAG TPA: restriction endonuclease subunit S [Rhodanobacteraceae bacterium]|nr:restriction endonuclease subunit S [Rhodanobacteraceae bacterium]
MSVHRPVRLGDIAESIDYGVTASASSKPIGPKFLRITDIQDGTVDWNTVPWCECDARSASDARLKSGDIVFARTGATTGKSFLIRDCPDDTVFASYLIRVRLSTPVDPRFVSHFFQTPRYWAQITKSARGVAQPGVNATTLKELQIPLPPLPEQRRIAEILDKADALRAKRRAALAQLDELTQSIFLDMFGDPGTNPRGWPVAPLMSLCTRVTDGTHQPPPWSSIGHPFLFVSNITSGELNFDTTKFISDETHAELMRHCPIELGDVLYSTVGSYGVPALVRNNRKFAFQRHIAHLKPNREIIEPEFLRVMLASPPLKRQADRVARGIAQKTVNLADIRKFVVFKPPLEAQRALVERVSTIRRLHGMHRGSLASCDALFASLQHGIFRGEL